MFAHAQTHRFNRKSLSIFCQDRREIQKWRQGHVTWPQLSLVAAAVHPTPPTTLSRRVKLASGLFVFFWGGGKRRP